MPTHPPTLHPPGQVHGDHITGTVGDAPGATVVIGKDIQVTIHQLADLETQPPTPGDPPYKGLADYDQSDETIFYGRRSLAGVSPETAVTSLSKWNRDR